MWNEKSHMLHESDGEIKMMLDNKILALKTTVYKRSINRMQSKG